MKKIEKRQLQMAIRQATRMRQQQEDPYYIAKALLTQNHQLRVLTNVMHKAEEYLHNSEDDMAHAELARAIEAVYGDASPHLRDGDRMHKLQA